MQDKYRRKLQKTLHSLIAGFTIKKVVTIIIGALICSFGIHNIHQRTAITEGGVFGLMLLLEHWFDISPAYITPILDLSCYLIAFKFLGKDFIKTSIFSTLCISLCYKLWEAMPYMLPDLTDYPIVASILGALCVGIGVGLVVRCNGSLGGDDALALTISKVTGIKISSAYLFTDVTVLVLSLSYIPLMRIIYSLITVTISSNVIDFIKNIRLKERSFHQTNTE